MQIYKKIQSISEYLADFEIDYRYYFNSRMPSNTVRIQCLSLKQHKNNCIKLHLHEISILSKLLAMLSIQIH